MLNQEIFFYMHPGNSRAHGSKSFFESNWNEIYDICLKKASYWRNHPAYQTAEDLAQIAVIKVWEAIERYDRERPMKAFVNEIAFNAFVDACRKDKGVYEISFSELYMEPSFQEKAHKKKGEVENEDEGEASPLEDISNETGSAAVELVPELICLPWRQRVVIERSFGLGDSWWEQTDDSIAEELGITRQTVISDRKKALESMQLLVCKRAGSYIAA